MDSLIKIDGKPLEKLIDVVSDAIGDICKPWQLVRVAKAEATAESIKAVEQAKTQAILNCDFEKAQYLDAINERLVKKETRRQKNIENVVAVAGKVLQAEVTVSEEPVNQDWVTRFFDIAQDVSDEEMQTLWGRILAGEIKQPKSYSLRTLEILRNMTKEEAEIFQKVAQFALSQGDDTFLFSSNEVLKKIGISYSYIAELIEIGLLQSGDFVTCSFNDKKFGIVYGNIVLIIDNKSNSQEISFSVRAFTTPGKELLQFVDIKPNMNYVQEFANAIKKDNVKVSYSEIINIDEDGTINYEDREVEL